MSTELFEYRWRYKLKSACISIEDEDESLDDGANIFLEGAFVEVCQRNIIDFAIVDQVLLHFFRFYIITLQISLQIHNVLFLGEFYLFLLRIFRCFDSDKEAVLFLDGLTLENL